MPAAGSPPPLPPDPALPARRRRPPRHRRPAGMVAAGAAVALGAAMGVVAVAPPVMAAGESVDVHLTTTSGSGGRNVVRGLERQPSVDFAASSPAAPHTITVNENVRHQRFAGGGASITDTTAYLFRGGPISAATRDEVMRKLFHPVDGIGLSFVRNPIGASDLSRPGNVSLVAAPAGIGRAGAGWRKEAGVPPRPRRRHPGGGARPRPPGSRHCPGWLPGDSGRPVVVRRVEG